jgi:hypothetical protein
MSSAANRDFWMDAARKVARRINLGWWLDHLATPLVITAVAGSCALLLVRREAPATPFWILAASVSAAIVFVAAAAWLIARRRFEQPAQSLVRLEADLHLRNALSAARAGVTPWPPPVTRGHKRLHWNFPRLAITLLGSLSLLAAGLLLPVSMINKPQPPPPEEPLAWKKIEADIQRFDADKLADESYLNDMRKRVDELRAQKQEDWFSQSSLEATDSLKKSHHAETQRIERELTRANKALGGLQQNAPAAGDAEKQRLAGEFDQALQGLQNGPLKPNAALLDQLKQLDPKNLGQLPPEQLEQLRKNLQNQAKAMGDAAGDGSENQDWNDELMADDSNKDGNCCGGQGDGPSQDGDGPGGNGGVNRGPGHAPNPLGKEHKKLNTGELSALESKDLSHATPGDLLQLQDGQHEVDQSHHNPIAGGNVNTSGAGGDRVWKESPDPAEQAALKRFFEYPPSHPTSKN